MTGSREWTDGRIVAAVIEGLAEIEGGDVTVIHGAARGADTTADCAAIAGGFPVEPYPADWATHGKAAGPIRNQQMLDEGKPDVVIAFKDGFQPDIPDDVEIVDPYTVRRPRGGTEHMVRIAKAAGIPVYVVSHG